jgi:peroxiredoxin
MPLALGDKAPPFSLPATDGTDQSYAGSSAAVVIFTCNHCPYALAWEDRLLQVGRDYPDFPIYAINPNDAERKPADSFDAMKERVAANPWPFPYLRDESQEVAAAYAALTTPDVFVFDNQGALAYRGAPDGDYEQPSQNAVWLRTAIEAVRAGKAPIPEETKPVGCSVKWKP